jgi:hypothetical protein
VGHLLSFLHLDLTSIVLTAATVIGAWLGTRVIRPGDHEKAQLLATIAADAAALVVAVNPTLAWGDLLEKVVKAISAAAGVPTTNQQAIERAAASALTALGKNPGKK